MRPSTRRPSGIRVALRATCTALVAGAVLAGAMAATASPAGAMAGVGPVPRIAGVAPESSRAAALSIVPTWTRMIDAPAAISDIATGGPRTVYTTGAARAGGHASKLHIAKYVDGKRRWQRFYDSPRHADESGWVIAVRGKAVYTGGIRATASGNELLVIRWNGAGKRVWTRTYKPGARRWIMPGDIEVDSAGNVTVLGVTTVRTGRGDIVLVSYGSDGSRRYVRRYDGPAHRMDWSHRMVLDSAGSVYIVGSSESRTGRDCLIIKYSRSGKRLWVRRYDGAVGGDDMLTSLRLRRGGGIYAAGFTTGGHTGLNGLLLAYNAAGRRLFVTEEPGGTDETYDQAFSDLELLPGGDVICVGAEHTGSWDRFYAVYSRTGKLRRRVTMPGAWRDNIAAIAGDGQGGVILTGRVGTGESTAQVYTERIRAGGTNWTCLWPAAPTTAYQGEKVAVGGMNVYVAGTFEAGGYLGGVLLGHIY